MIYSPEKEQILVKKTPEFLQICKRNDLKKHEAEFLIESLKEIIRFHEYRYYVLSNPVISDSEYDSLFSFLKRIETAFPFLHTPDSPTERIASAFTKEFTKIDHLSPMLSLDNSYNSDDLHEFDRRLKELTGEEIIDYFAEPKYDGAGLSLVYENDILVRGATRGDGVTGENITPNVKVIKSIPLKTGFSDHGIYKIELRGEALISKEVFENINKKRVLNGEPVFANARNAVSGTLRLQNSGLVAERQIEVIIYEITFATDKNGNDILSKINTNRSETVKFLHKNGFKTSINDCGTFHGIEDGIAFCNDWEQKRNSFRFEIDGLVFKANETRLQEIAGYTAHHPRWAIAYKFSARQATTTLIDVEFQVGRTGIITPVAKLDKVELGGVSISSATMFNEEFIRLKDIKIGDRVLIERAGDVIPYIVKPVAEFRTGSEKEIIYPENCPVCQSMLVKTEEEAAYRCVSEDCPAQKVEKIIHFVSKDAMNIDGMGENIVVRFYNEGLIKTVSDIYHIDFDQVKNLQGFKTKSVENLKKAIEESKSRTLDRLIFALGIRFVGQTSAKTLARAAGNIDNLKNFTTEELLQLKDVGPKVAGSITEYFSSKQHLDLIEKLRNSGVKMQTDFEIPEEAGKLSGKVFVITGTLSKYSRTEASALIEKNGGTVTGSVSSKTDYLVCGTEPGSKLQKAQQTGTVKILNEFEFEELISR